MLYQDLNEAWRPATRVSQALIGILIVASGGLATAAPPTWTAPPAAAARKNPLTDSKAAAAAGASLFATNCVACHGNKGRGDGPAAVALNPKPANLANKTLWEQSDGALFWKISHGHTPMPGFSSTMTEDQRWQLVDFVRSLSPKPAAKAATKDTNAEKAEKAAPKKDKKAAKPAPEAKPVVDEAEPSGDEPTAVPAETSADQPEVVPTSEGASVEDSTDSASAAQVPDVADSVDSSTDAPPMDADTTTGTTEPPPATPDAAPQRDRRTAFVFGGYGTTDLEVPIDGDPTFGGSFNPIFLVSPADWVLFEGELELELEDAETSLKLETGQLSLVATPWLTFGIGKFLNPMNFFVERQHPNWINKLPDKPIAVYDGLLAESVLGVQARGGVAIGTARLGYSIFGANAPRLVTDAEDPAEAGILEGDNFSNVDGHIAGGGRIGFLPIKEVEVGYGAEFSAVGPDGVLAQLHSVDLNLVLDSAAIKGVLAVRGQWVWSMIGDVVYDPDGELGYGPLNFTNNRQGGYAQVSYRPSDVETPFVRDLEYVVRVDHLDQHLTPAGEKESRGALGLDWWFLPSGVVKVAYEMDSVDGGALEHAMLGQVALGF